MSPVAGTKRQTIGVAVANRMEDEMKTTEREDKAIAAMLFAYAQSCKRSETPGRKWTMNDQTAHEKLKDALLLYMDSSTIRTAAMQIRGIQSISA